MRSNHWLDCHWFIIRCNVWVSFPKIFTSASNYEGKQTTAPLLLQVWEQSLAGIHFSAPQAHYQEAFESDMYDFFPKKLFPPTSTDQMAAKWLVKTPVLETVEGTGQAQLLVHNQDTAIGSALKYSCDKNKMSIYKACLVTYQIHV